MVFGVERSCSDLRSGQCRQLTFVFVTGVLFSVSNIVVSEFNNASARISYSGIRVVTLTKNTLTIRDTIKTDDDYVIDTKGFCTQQYKIIYSNLELMNFDSEWRDSIYKFSQRSKVITVNVYLTFKFFKLL